MIRNQDDRTVSLTTRDKGSMLLTMGGMAIPILFSFGALYQQIGRLEAKLDSVIADHGQRLARIERWQDEEREHGSNRRSVNKDG